jgi:hypothetical protein
MTGPEYPKSIHVAVTRDMIDHAKSGDPNRCIIKLAVVGIINKCGREDAQYLSRALADHRMLIHLADLSKAP